MADAIANVNGMDSFAHVGEPGWHNKGQKLPYGASIETWAGQAGLAYTIEKASLYYRPTCDRPTDGAPMPKARIVADRVAQVRSDTGADLGIVSQSFQTVQPIEVLEFFRTYAEQAGAQLETAGALHGGKLYFALARIGDAVQVSAGDRVVPYIYLSTACDGTRATEARFCATRVVCANTDAMARGEGKATHKTTHRTVWVAQNARDALETANREFGAYCEMARQLAEVRVSSMRAAELTEALVGAAKTESGRTSQGFASIMSLFQGSGRGADLPGSRGTAWGYLNAVTQFADFEVRATSVDNRLVSSMFGNGDKLKAAARDAVLQLVA